MTPPQQPGPNPGAGGQARGGGKGGGQGGKGGGGGKRRGGGGGGKPRASGGGKGGGAGASGGGPRAGQGGKGGKGGGKQRGGRPVEQDRAAELARPLKKVLERIPATQREVLEWRMGLKDGHPHDLSSTAQQLGLSVQETKEIEQRAFEHIREVVPLAQLQKFLGG